MFLSLKLLATLTVLSPHFLLIRRKKGHGIASAMVVTRVLRLLQTPMQTALEAFAAPPVLTLPAALHFPVELTSELSLPANCRD